MYRVLIVEDEKMEREGIRQLLSWMDLDIEISGEASNGKQALDMAEQTKPDIVITDIKMVGISGLQLASILQSWFPDIKIIFITGYQDFTYAKNAISLGAYGYVLKPVDEEELYQAVKKAVDQFDFEIYTKREKNILTRQVEETLPLLQQQFLKKLLLNTSYSDEFLARIKDLGIFNEGETYHVVVISLDNYRLYERRSSKEQIWSLTQTILHDLNKSIGRDLSSTVVQIEDNLYSFLLKQLSSDTGEIIESCLKRVIKNLVKIFNISTTIAISQSTSSCNNINRLYEETLDATKAKWCIGSGRVIWASEMGYASNDIVVDKKLELDYTDIQANITKMMLFGEKYEIVKYLDEYFSNLPAELKNTKKHFQTLCLKILEICIKLLTEANQSVSDIIRDRLSMLDELLLYETYDSLKKWVIDRVMELTICMSKIKTNRSSRLVEKVYNIIQDYYNQDITIEMISDMVYFSPNYISRIFKNETGITILQCLTKVRMEKAVEMMKNPSLKIAEITEKVGYRSASYFGQIFKQYYGVTPKEYMDKMESI